MFGAQYPIMSAPMGPDISSPTLVAAVSSAGGIGFLRAPDQDNPELVQELIRKTRRQTDKPFGIGIILSFPHERNLKAALHEEVAVLHISWGEFPKPLVEKAHRAGVKVIHQVGSVEEARKAAEAGVDAIIAQSIEAGGHVCGKVPMFELLPSVVEAVKPFGIPVVAAGGIVDARGYVAAVALGAQGVCLGTRFVATFEAYAHPVYKRALVDASDSSTEYTNIYGRARWPGAPQRVLRTAFFEEWKDKVTDDTTELNQPIVGSTTIYEKDESVPRFSGKVPNVMAKGDIKSMCMYAGTGVGRIKSIESAAAVVRGLVEGARDLVEQELTNAFKHSRKEIAGPKTMV